MSSQQPQGSSSTLDGGPPTNVTVVMKDDLIQKQQREWNLVCMEARSVSVWALVTPLVRIALSPLVSDDKQTLSAFSILASWIVMLFPRGMAQDMVPGFIFASAWILLAIRDSFGSVPNVPIRICEMMMGRLSLRELCIVLPIHFVCTLSTFMILNLLLPSSIASMGLSPITYSTENPWLVDFIRQVLATVVFSVLFLVVPELLRLNNLPPWLAGLVVYPVYSFGVDANGKGSTFGPNVLYALACMHHREGLGQAIRRFGGVLVGGVLGGIVMRKYFPDDPK